MNDGQIVFEISADGTKAYASIEEITRKLKEAGGKWENSAKQSSDNIADMLTGAVKKIAAGITAAKIGQMILQWGKDALQVASDLEEVQNVVDVTFGDGADKINSWAKQAGKAFGLTELQAKKFTSTLGAMMKSAGLTGSEISTMSMDLAGLAADMASFYNLDFETAFDKIRSGISGETMPLKQLGINMSVANLNAFALQQGLKKTYDQMSQSEQTVLRYQYLMSATADAQGDFARTADGYANSQRRIETAFETIKAAGGKLLLEVVSPLVTGMADFLNQLTTIPEKTVLDEFADIDSKTATKFAEIQGQVQTVTDYTAALRELFGNTEDADSIVAQISQYGVTSKETDEYLRDLGYSTEEITSIQTRWLGVCKQLVKTIPGLSDIIDTETGAIDGGTLAIEDYVRNWEEGERKLALLQALAAKREAWRTAHQALYELDYAQWEAQHRLKNARDALANVYGLEFDENGTITNESNLRVMDRLEVGSEAYQQYFADIRHYNILTENATTATNAYNTALAESQESLGYLDEAEEALRQEYGLTDEEIEQGTATVEAATGSFAALASQMMQTAQAGVEAQTAIAEYAASVRDNIQSSVDSTIGGFQKIESAASRFETKQTELKEQFDELRRNGKIEGSFTFEVYAAGQNTTAQSMIDALESQNAYIQEYQQNLEAARRAGVSEDVLASLSDGSVESSQYLYALANTASREQIEEINQLWAQVSEGKTSFVDTLTEQALAVDEKYQGMVTAAEQAAQGLDVSETAGDSVSNTMTAIISNIDGKLPELTSAVDGIINQLNRIDGVTISVNFSTSDPVTLPTKKGRKLANVEQFAVGLDWVPFDGFLASLHEGESILTAEENRIWQRFKAGSSGGVDYDQMGSVMRDNIKPGGNVYLDGRIVGGVISDMQANQYRTLTRSGWQR